jgi:hypothetical protein
LIVTRPGEGSESAAYASSTATTTPGATSPSTSSAAGALEEVERIVGRIRARWPRVRILLRADSGFAREALMAWCEATRVDFAFGLARNPRLVEELTIEMAWAEEEATRTSQSARRYKDFRWSTLDSWSRRRRVIDKAEWTRGEANPRFVVTSLRPAEIDARSLYERVYCARGDMENRVKECQLDLFAGRASAATMRANQLRLWFASMAYVLLCAPRRIGLAHTYPVRRGHLRHAPPRPAQDRRPGPPVGPAHQGGDGLGAPAPERVRLGPCQARSPRASLTAQTPQAAILLTNAAPAAARTGASPTAPISAPAPITSAQAAGQWLQHQSPTPW